VKRGLFIREALLCEEIPPPISCDVVIVPDLDPSMNTRQVIEAINEVDGTACANCHAPLINPFGHALGHFNGMGQYMEEEPLLIYEDLENDPYYWNCEVEECFDYSEIDASDSAWFNGGEVSFDGPHEMNEILLGSGNMEECFARSFFRHAVREIETDADEALIQQLGESLFNGMTLEEFMIEVALSDRFRSRNWPSEEEENPDTGDTGEEEEEEELESAPDISDADSNNGSNLYSGACGWCHGPTGEGGSGPNIRVLAPNLTDDELYTVILNGRNSMPGGLLDSTSQIADVMAFIRSWEE
jgi:mono/diheme cytochrome c family protein